MTPPLDSGVHLRPIFSKTRTGRHSRRIYSSPLPTPLGIFAKEVRDDDLPEYEHRVSPTPLVIAPVRRGLWWLSARARLVRTISRMSGGRSTRRTRWRCHRVASIEGVIKILEKHVFDHRLCIHGAQPPCHTPPCAQWSASASSPLGGRAFSGWPLRTTSSFHGAPW